MRILKIIFLTAAALALTAALVARRKLPQMLTEKVNQRLRSIPGHSGSVESADIDWKGRMVLRGFTLSKIDPAPPAIAFSADQIELDFSLFHALRKRAVLDVMLEKPRFEMRLRQRKPGDPRSAGAWMKPFRGLPPFRIRRLTLHGAALRFANDQHLPPLDISFNEVNLTASNLANRSDLFSSGTADVDGKGLLLNHSPITISAKIKPLENPVAFDFKGDVQKFDLMNLNPLLQRFGGFKLEGGSLDMQSELRAEHGEFAGTVERRIEGLDIKNQHRGLFKNAKEVLVQTWINWKADKADRIEKRFHLSGPLGYLEEDPLLAAVWVGKHAFIQSLKANVSEELRLDRPEVLQDEWAERQAEELKKERSKNE